MKQTPTDRSGPAYRIHTRRLLLRCWEPVDAPLLKAAIDTNRDHLRPWMLWAEHGPEPLPATIERIRRWRGQFDLDQDFVYAIFNRDETQVLGGCGLHTHAGKEAREIGYWIDSEHINQGLATEVAAALTRVAFEIDRVQWVEIRCDPDNVRSAAIPRKLGYTHEATLRRRTQSDGRPGGTMLWTLLADEYPTSPAAEAEIAALNAMGQRIPLGGAL